MPDSDAALDDTRKRLDDMISEQEQIVKALIEKAEQMLMHPLAKTVRTASDDGKTSITEIHPAKWTMGDATKFYGQACDLLDRIAELKKRADQLELEEDRREKLPAWVPAYLAAWGGGWKEGKRVTVTQSAELAGTSASNVRNLRQRSKQFQRLEYIARHGDALDMQSAVEAGLRGNMPVIFDAFMQLVKKGDARVVIKAMEWLLDKAAALEIRGSKDAPLTVRQVEHEPERIASIIDILAQAGVIEPGLVAGLDAGSDAEADEIHTA